MYFSGEYLRLQPCATAVITPMLQKAKNVKTKRLDAATKDCSFCKINFELEALRLSALFVLFRRALINFFVAICPICPFGVKSEKYEVRDN